MQSVKSYMATDADEVRLRGAISIIRQLYDAKEKMAKQLETENYDDDRIDDLFDGNGNGDGGDSSSEDFNEGEEDDIRSQVVGALEVSPSDDEDEEKKAEHNNIIEGASVVQKVLQSNEKSKISLQTNNMHQHDLYDLHDLHDLHGDNKSYTYKEIKKTLMASANNAYISQSIEMFDDGDDIDDDFAITQIAATNDASSTQVRPSLVMTLKSAKSEKQLEILRGSSHSHSINIQSSPVLQSSYKYKKTAIGDHDDNEIHVDRNEFHFNIEDRGAENDSNKHPRLVERDNRTGLLEMITEGMRGLFGSDTAAKVHTDFDGIAGVHHRDSDGDSDEDITSPRPTLRASEV